MIRAAYDWIGDEIVRFVPYSIKAESGLGDREYVERGSERFAVLPERMHLVLNCG